MGYPNELDFHFQRVGERSGKVIRAVKEEPRKDIVEFAIMDHRCGSRTANN